MKNLSLMICLSAQLLLVACSPIKTEVTNQYSLTKYGTDKLVKNKSKTSILISQPEAMAGFTTEDMRYIEKPFEVSTFVHNSWVSSPGNMLYPLLMQSLQKTGYFFAVASGPYLDKADYRLDSQIITLQQNFLTKPSTMEFRIKIMLTHVSDNRVIVSRIFNENISCPIDTPYGGVIAANKASEKFTQELAKFIVKEVRNDTK